MVNIITPAIAIENKSITVLIELPTPNGSAKGCCAGLFAEPEALIRPPMLWMKLR
jgi:hypothetical protein